jgi:hypothetical protein
MANRAPDIDRPDMQRKKGMVWYPSVQVPAAAAASAASAGLAVFRGIQSVLTPTLANLALNLKQATNQGSNSPVERVQKPCELHKANHCTLNRLSSNALWGCAFAHPGLGWSYCPDSAPILKPTFFGPLAGTTVFVAEAVSASLMLAVIVRRILSVWLPHSKSYCSTTIAMMMSMIGASEDGR